MAQLAGAWDYSLEVVRAGMALVHGCDGDPVDWYPAIAPGQWKAQNAGRGLRGGSCFGNIESLPR